MRLSIQVMSEAPKKHDWRWWLKWFKATTHMFMLGIGVTALGSNMLFHERPKWLPAPWNTVAFVAFMVAWAWLIWVSSPGLPPDFDARPSSESTREIGFPLLFAIVAGVLRWQWERDWAVACLGPVAALALWAISHKQGIRPFAAAAVWTFAGFAALQFPWSNPQRFLLAMVIGGLATAIQGAFASLGFYRTLRMKLAEAHGDGHISSL